MFCFLTCTHKGILLLIIFPNVSSRLMQGVICFTKEIDVTKQWSSKKSIYADRSGSFHLCPTKPITASMVKLITAEQYIKIALYEFCHEINAYILDAFLRRLLIRNNTSYITFPKNFRRPYLIVFLKNSHLVHTNTKIKVCMHYSMKKNLENLPGQYNKKRSINAKT